jgi:hypothetical protein
MHSYDGKKQLILIRLNIKLRNFRNFLFLMGFSLLRERSERDNKPPAMRVVGQRLYRTNHRTARIVIVQATKIAKKGDLWW